MQNQKQKVIRDYEQRIEALEKPKMRITDKRQKKLHRAAVVADIADAAGGLIPVIGDAAMPFGTYEIFKYWFQSYDVEASEFLNAGGGGKTGKITVWVLDFFTGLVPVLGDFLDLFFASWYFTIRSATKEIRDRDRKKIKKYKQKVRRLRTELRQRLMQMHANPQQSMQSIKSPVSGQSRSGNRGASQTKKRRIPSKNTSQSSESIAPKKYTKK